MRSQMTNDIVDVGSKQLLTEPEALSYSGMARTSFRKWALEIGAVRKRGRRTLYHRKTIDSFLDAEKPASYGKRGGVNNV